MTRKTALIAALNKLALLLELDGANSFRTGAFTRGARALEDTAVDIEAAAEAGTLTDIDGIGKGLADKIAEFLRTGAIAELAELEARYPAGLVEMTEVPGFGAKKARAVYDTLGVTSLVELEAACRDGRIEGLKGFGKKSAANVLAGIEARRRHSGRFRLDVALRASAPILAALRAHSAVNRAESAGSLRRWRETIGDLDFVVSTDDAAAVSAMFVAMPGVIEVIGQGDTKTSVRLESGMQADLRCVADVSFPFILQHFSGSKEHNTRLRSRAKERGLKSNEYGLYPEGSDVSLPAKDEADIYRHLGLDFIEPELREDMGEIEAAESGKLPKLIEAGDLRGLMHMHTHSSDGVPTLEDYAQWAVAHKIAWMGIADHSQSAAYAGGLQPHRIREQWAAIDEANARWQPRGVRLLKGIESDILAEGQLDYDEEMLAGFDFVVASVHSRFKLDEDAQTARIVRAIEHPRTTILGHATGRLLLERDSYAVRIDAIIDACARTGTIIEINANPARLDMDWRHVRRAVERGCLVSIGPDAHELRGLDDTRFGVAMARKAWVPAAQCVNTWSVEEFLAYARTKRR